MKSNYHVLISAAISLLLITGCASMRETARPTEAGLRKSTALHLGYSIDSVKISNIRTESTATFWVANTPKGTYACSAATGLYMAVATMGMAGIECNKQ